MDRSPCESALPPKTPFSASGLQPLPFFRFPTAFLFFDALPFPSLFSHSEWTSFQDFLLFYQPAQGHFPDTASTFGRSVSPPFSSRFRGPFFLAFRFSLSAHKGPFFFPSVTNSRMEPPPPPIIRFLTFGPFRGGFRHLSRSFFPGVIPFFSSFLACGMPGLCWPSCLSDWVGTFFFFQHECAGFWRTGPSFFGRYVLSLGISFFPIRVGYFPQDKRSRFFFECSAPPFPGYVDVLKSVRPFFIEAPLA